MHVNRCCNSWRQNCDQERSREDFKCEDLIIESQCRWNVEAKVIPEIIWVNGTISKSLRPYLSNIPGKHEIKALQKNSHIGHCTYITESANVKVLNIFHRQNNITCNTNCIYRTAATLYNPETWFRYTIVNNLHKGGDDDDVTIYY